MPRIKHLFIANRGEVACRIAATARKRGTRTTGVYSEADRGGRHTRLVDEAICIGPPAAAESYLQGSRIIDEALRVGADAIHPGYGFLAENADFAESVAKAGLRFVGPSPSSIRQAGDKVLAKQIAHRLGIPTPASLSLTASLLTSNRLEEELTQFATQAGFPLLIKAAAGGGGRGMRRVSDVAAFRDSVERASREAKAFFNDETVFVERYVEHARHIEVQIFGEQSGIVHALGTRDCSLQRNHQKVIEEAPAPHLERSVVERLCSYARHLALEMKYYSAGTVEFLVHRDEVFFLEINARLQVEHTVTEAIYGVDLVEWQLLVAEEVPLPPSPPVPAGHAIQLRICAENPRENFVAQTGRFSYFPSDRLAGLRIDSGYASGDVVSSFYDSLVAKVIVHGASREESRARALSAIGSFQAEGVLTNTEYLSALLREPSFIACEHHTDTAGVVRDTLVNGGAESVAIAAWLVISSPRSGSSWDTLEGFCFEGKQERTVRCIVNDTVVERTVRFLSNSVWDIGGVEICILNHDVDWVELGALRNSLRLDVRRFGEAYWVHSILGTFCVAPAPLSLRPPRAVMEGGFTLKSPLPGKVLSIKVREGDAVVAGTPLLSIESMKMEHMLISPHGARVEKIMCTAQALVSKDEPLLQLALVS